ncbi:MAG: sigma-54 dependent transcriptional regulator, partial [Pseudomonadota bacterium]
VCKRMGGAVPHVLIVDQDPVRRGAVGARLGELGWQVLERPGTGPAPAAAVVLMGATGQGATGQGATGQGATGQSEKNQRQAEQGPAAPLPGAPDAPVLALLTHDRAAQGFAAGRAGATAWLVLPDHPGAQPAAVVRAFEAMLAAPDLNSGTSSGASDRTTWRAEAPGTTLGTSPGKNPATAQAGPAKAGSASGSRGFAGLIATAPSMQMAVAEAERAAKARITVLLTGPSGTGKERFAQAIHAASPRGAAPFVAVNCGALPEHLVESLLFGHEKGAFTGAERAAPGRFREAQGGTLFLDEIGELPLAAQVKLLRALQEGEVDPVGGRGPVAVDVRVLAATNRDLRAEIAAGRFREDLFFRLAGIEIALPPLAARPEDIPALALQHATQVALLEQRSFAGFGDEVAGWLRAQPWPGNVRELQNVVHRALVMSETAQVPLSAFEVQRVDCPAPGAARAEPTADGPAEQDQNSLSGDAAPETGRSERRPPPQIRRLEEIEAEAIADALMLCSGNVTLAARRLGIGRSTLYRKMSTYGIAQEPGEGGAVDLVTS